jgi:WD40 repeat protein
MCLNYVGTLLATASDKGTLIRIFSIDTGNPLQELRRGAEKADIYSISFDFQSKWLACSSDKSTIHVFSVKQKFDTEVGIKLSDEEETKAVGEDPNEEEKKIADQDRP